MSAGAGRRPRPFFSAVISTYNRWPLVAEAIESVLAQTFTSFELIVVDDGSADGTAEMIEERHPRARLIRQPRRGVSAARNAGVNAAAGAWIAFLDSDDLWDAGKLEGQFEAIQAAPSIRIMHTGEIWFRNGRRVNPGKKHAKRGTDGGGDDELFRRSAQMCLISPSSVVIHKEVFETVGGFDESMPVCEDYDLWLRAMTRYPVAYLPEKLAVKRNAYENKSVSPQLSLSTWGMDRYRIYALEKLIGDRHLSHTRRNIVLREIVRKARIVATGCAKRGRTGEAERWRAVGRHASGRLAAGPHVSTSRYAPLSARLLPGRDSPAAAGV